LAEKIDCNFCHSRQHKLGLFMKLFTVKIAPMVVCLTTMIWVTTAAAMAQSVANDEFSGDSTAGAEKTWIDPDGRAGTLVIVGGGNLPSSVIDTFVASLSRSDDDPSVVVIGAAASDPKAAASKTKQWLKDAGITNVVLPSEDVNTTDDGGPLSEAIASAEGVWICGGQQSRLATAYLGTDVEFELGKLLDRGGVVGGTSAGAAIMSRVMIASGSEVPNMAVGFDLLPCAIVDQHFSQRQRLGRLRVAVQNHLECYGLGIDEGTAVVVKGRRLKVLGEGTVTVVLGKTRYRAAEEKQIPSGSVVDLTQWRRAAVARRDGVDPGVPRYGKPTVRHGSLVIVGGGGMPQPIVDRFVELAGGSNAHIVVLPTAGSREQARGERVPGFLRNANIASVTMLPQMGPEEVAGPEFQEAMKRATGVWFGGGRQWNFVDAYDGTNAVDLFHKVLERGGVIGGSSAGATIQGEFLVRGHPLGNTVMMAEGYERGFSFLPGVAIDQHFSQRGRKPDLIPVIESHPQLLGIGIDEATAVIVRGTEVEVVGNHAAHFLTARRLAEIERAIDAGDEKRSPLKFRMLIGPSTLVIRSIWRRWIWATDGWRGFVIWRVGDTLASRLFTT
jgi:cyanophycinase